jgi:hypothetical protein
VTSPSSIASSAIARPPPVSSSTSHFVSRPSSSSRSEPVPHDDFLWSCLSLDLHDAERNWIRPDVFGSPHLSAVKRRPSFIRLRHRRRHPPPLASSLACPVMPALRDREAAGARHSTVCVPRRASPALCRPVDVVATRGHTLEAETDHILSEAHARTTPARVGPHCLPPPMTQGRSPTRR